MRRDLWNWAFVGLSVAALAAFGYSANTAYAASRETRAAVCQSCLSQGECNHCCLNAGYQGGTCTMSGVCLCH
jgi:hypothetical protein